MNYDPRMMGNPFIQQNPYAALQGQSGIQAQPNIDINPMLNSPGMGGPQPQGVNPMALAGMAQLFDQPQPPPMQAPVMIPGMPARPYQPMGGAILRGYG